MNDFKQYKIDFENGSIPICDLSIGDRVVDTSWVWEHRTGDNYSGSGEVKPITWIVVAKNHYSRLEPHVTLLAEGLIGQYIFDDSTNRAHQTAEWGYNHWGECGSAARGLRFWFNSSGNATRGLRPWLNSTGIHAGEGFYRVFSDSFKKVVLTTTVPNKEWKNGKAYSTQDYVFIPSTTELGDTKHKNTYQIGVIYPSFQGAVDGNRVACHDGETGWYWTRSPVSYSGSSGCYVSYPGEFDYSIAIYGNYGVRPALNLKSGTLVSEIKDLRVFDIRKATAGII